MTNDSENFKYYIFNTYRNITPPLIIHQDEQYHIIYDDKGAFLIYNYNEKVNEFSYVLFEDMEWKIVMGNKVSA